ncbi:MAG: hypothetical protein PWP03_332 [Candidatus Woesearchaeota archaeon]|nr:hypothetical protein [Candidatus Woesearchaeota archaeon]MDN5327694.1 hypothetical protein [Candidatus Woesearchaeota archaeon]
MTEHDFYETKELLEKELDELREKYGYDRMPKLEIKRDGSDITISFEISANVDKARLINIFTTNIGDMKVSPFKENELLLFYGNNYGLKNMISFNQYLDGTRHYVSIHKRDKNFSNAEINAILEAYVEGNSITEGKQGTLERLLNYGVTVYDSKEKLGWDYIAGYDDVKAEIRDTVILPLKHPEVYDDIVKGTRMKFESIRPKAVLFEGPPGTGKTTTAKIIASETEIPLVYVPIESIMTKWYGESERNLAGIFDTANEFDNAILFLDEIDSLATSRDDGIHEATRRVLSVLLRKIDGIESSEQNVIVIGSTNRKQDLDPALLSRFDVSIYFRLPNLEERAKIFGNYAKHLRDEDRLILAEKSENFSGRNIKDLCEYCERSWASKRLRNEVDQELPTLDEYIRALERRKSSFEGF